MPTAFDPPADVVPRSEAAARPSRVRSTASWLTRIGWCQSLLVGLLAGVFVFWLRTVPIVSDPFDYVRAGIEFPDMTWNKVGTTRYGLILPLAALTQLFHDSEATFYLMPIVATVAMVASAHWLAARSFGRVAGLLTVVLLLGASPVILNATRLYPDIFSASATTVAVAFAVGTREHWRRSPAARTRGVVLLLVTGVLVGLSWWMRETSVFAWPAVAVALFWRGGPPKRLTAVCVGGAALGMFVLECVISALVFDDPMARLHALTASDMSVTTNPNDLPYLNKGRWAYFVQVPLQMFKIVDGQWLLCCGALAVVGGVLIGRRVAFFAFWFVSCLVLLVIAGGALNPASPSLRLDLVRYWLPFLVPMLIAGVGTITTVVRSSAVIHTAFTSRPPRHRIVIGVLATGLALTPVAPTVHMVRNNPEFVVTNGHIMNEFRDWLATNEADVKVIYADLATTRQLPTYARDFWGNRIADVEFRQLAPPYTVEPGSYVVFFSDGLEVCTFCSEWVEQIHKDRPRIKRGWDLVWRSRGSIFKIYQAPERTPRSSSPAT